MAVRLVPHRVAGLMLVGRDVEVVVEVVVVAAVVEVVCMLVGRDVMVVAEADVEVAAGVVVEADVGAGKSDCL